MRLYVPLNRQEYEALEQLAYAERRRPQDQAAAMLARVLASDLTSPRPNNDVTTSQPVPCREPREPERVSA